MNATSGSAHSEKREQILAKYEKLKKKVRDWECAVQKTEGKKPSKDDMKVAPKDVQEAYRDFVRLRKYMEQNVGNETPKNATVLTPGKIFLGKHRQQLNRGDHSYLTRIPSAGSGLKKKANVFQAKPVRDLPAAHAPTLGFRSSKQSIIPKPTPSNDEKSNRSFSNFKFNKLFQVSEKLQQKPEENENPDSEEETVSSEEKELAGFPLLGRFSANKFLPGVSTSGCPSPVLGDQDKCNQHILESETENNGVEIGNPELKSNPVFSRTSKMRVRELDEGWLTRLDDADQGEEPCNNSSNELGDTSILDHYSANGVNTTPLNCVNVSSEDLQDENMPMDVDTEFKENHTEFDMNTNIPPITYENTDSGICVNSNSIFNSEELEEAFREVMNETMHNQSVISNADGSLVYSFSEDACLPSTSNEMLSTVDTKAISDIIKSLSDENESSSSSSLINQTKDVNEVHGGGRKRTATIAFSPSPEKVTPKRKFFKSTRGERLAKYSLTSYKPLSPQKKGKVSKSSQMSQVSSSPLPKRITRASTHKLTLCEETIETNTTEVDKSGDDGDNLVDAREARSSISPDDKEPKRKRVLKSSKSNLDRRKKKLIEGNEMTSESAKMKPQLSRKSNTVSEVFNEEQDIVKTSRRKKRQQFTRSRQDKKDLLESKISTGKLNDNYVRIDTKRKVFVRGHKKVSAVKMKRLDWKQRMSATTKEAKISSFSCNKCGEKGHFAKFCTKDSANTESVTEEDNSPFPTLEEAARMVWSSSGTTNKRVNIYSSAENKTTTLDNIAGNGDPTTSAIDISVEDTTEDVSPVWPTLIESVEPYFAGGQNSAQDFEESVIQEGLEAFGYQSFRPGQQEAVSRVLNGLSTLVILSTGSGKSLCYQLPAYLYGKKYPGALTLCVSPLVSLMEDQIQGIPLFLRASCLHSNMTAKQKEVVLDKVKSKKLDILLVSPEAVCGGLFGLLKGAGDSLPKISFACIDEVHCVSQWSHNFRPSYLQLCKILREKLQVKTILGLTATATKTTVQSICDHLSIDPSTTIRGELIPKNLKLTVSRDVHKDEALISLLRGERFRNCDSIIIYCTRRDVCEKIATFVRTQLQEISNHKIIKTKSGARLSASCEAYHAGMSARKRKNVQEGFMSGEVRIVVATVAFGMGIDKSDIRAVIHYNMPNAFESYVQEIGRAGRDGLPAHCHLFLDNTKRNDLCELKRHVYANSVDRPTIRKLLRKVFKPCKCRRIEQLKNTKEISLNDNLKTSCPGHEVALSIERTVEDLDLPQENITTLLCYLELDERKWIEILPLTYQTCKIQSYCGAKLIKSAASRCPPLAVAIALLKEKNKFSESDTFLQFNVIDVSATVGWNSSVVKRELKNLEWIGSQFDEKGNPMRFRKSGLLVEFSDLAYRVKAPGSLSDDVADSVLNLLHGRNLRQEQAQLHQLHRVYQALLSVSSPNINKLCDEYDEGKSDQLKNFIYEYFGEDDDPGKDTINPIIVEDELSEEKQDDLRRSVRHLIDSSKDIHFTARSIARIFQGISSPCFPSDVWYKNRDFWRRYLDVDFHQICRIASKEL